MKKNKRNRLPGGLFAPALALIMLLIFLAALANLSDGNSRQGKQQLEDALRRSAVACYAAEGIYPADVSYLEEHYGIQIDKKRYTVIYNVFASNLMPDITVLENDP